MFNKKLKRKLNKHIYKCHFYQRKRNSIDRWNTYSDRSADPTFCPNRGASIVVMEMRNPESIENRFKSKLITERKTFSLRRLLYCFFHLFIPWDQHNLLWNESVFRDLKMTNRIQKYIDNIEKHSYISLCSKGFKIQRT